MIGRLLSFVLCLLLTIDIVVHSWAIYHAQRALAEFHDVKATVINARDAVVTAKTAVLGGVADRAVLAKDAIKTVYEKAKILWNTKDHEL